MYQRMHDQILQLQGKSRVFPFFQMFCDTAFGVIASLLNEGVHSFNHFKKAKLQTGFQSVKI